MQIFRGSPLDHENHENITPRKIPAIRYITYQTFSDLVMNIITLNSLSRQIRRCSVVVNLCTVIPVIRPTHNNIIHATPCKHVMGWKKQQQTITIIYGLFISTLTVTDYKLRNCIYIYTILEKLLSQAVPTLPYYYT